MCISQRDAIVAALDGLPNWREVEPAPAGAKVYQGLERRLYVLPNGKVKQGLTPNHAAPLPARMLDLLVEVGTAKLQRAREVVQ